MPPFKKHRKRGAGKPGGSANSKSLRNARDLIQSGKQAEGLALLARLSSETKNPGRRAKIALLVGTSESGLSRHTEAAAAFAKAGQLARQAGDPSLALQAGIGEVRSLLRSLRTEEAKAAANLVLEDISTAQRSFDVVADLRPEDLAARGAVTLPPRPPRATVALTGIAAAFVQSGLTDEARLFLEKAVLLSPNGASRARQALARLALAADDPELAERHARESLQMGRFQAKTIAAWPLYLDARARQNKSPILEPALFEALLHHTTGRILSASVLAIVRVLRGHGDPAWKSIAETIFAKPAKADPVILTEIEKILHADAKLTLSEPSEAIAARSLKLFKAADASPAEQIAHAKTHVRHTLESGGTPDLARLIRIGRNRYGDEHATAIRHTTALAAMLARKHDLARGWLMALLDDLGPGTEARGKALWALARMESLFEDRSAEAAHWYLELAVEEKTPPRFRIQAMLNGFEFLAKSGNPANSPETSEAIRSILATTDDWRLILDAARQLGLAGPDFANLKIEAARRGTELADQAMIVAISSTEVLSILEYLTRKLYWDLDRSDCVVDRWVSLSEKEKAEFYSTGGSLWYDYLSTVFLSFAASGRIAEAETLIASVLDHEYASPEGYVILGSSYADYLLRSDRSRDAFAFFEWISKEQPTHRKAANAHYWLALRQLIGGNQKQSIVCANAARACFGGHPSLESEWNVDAKAIWLKFSLKEEELKNTLKFGYQESYMKSILKLIRIDIDAIGK